MHDLKKLKVLAVGAVGSAAGLIVPELLKRGAAVRGFVHKKSDEQIARSTGLTDIVVGDLANRSDVATFCMGRLEIHQTSHGLGP